IDGKEPGRFWNNLGNTLKSLGRLDEAEQSFRTSLVLRPNAQTLSNLGATLREQMRLTEAEAVLREALATEADDRDANYNLGGVLYDLTRHEEAEPYFRRALASDPDCAPPRAALAMCLRARGAMDEAAELLEEGLARKPEDPELGFVLRLIYSSSIPAWHIPMINDHERNDAYDAALRQAVTPGCLVLEVGTGSGIVSMMAARAGAGKVVTCEMSAPLVRVARRNIARNGYAGSITVVHKKSTDMRLGEDLPERADVFVSELINVGMLAPDMLAILKHARDTLVKPGGRIIPEASTVHGMLVETPDLARINPVGLISGFDMSAFDIFRSPGCAQIDLGADAHIPLSRPFTALDFDFTRDMPESGRETLTLPVTANGLCHGIAFWFDLRMWGDVLYDSGSRNRGNHWKQAMQFFPRPIPVRAGQALTVVAGYDRKGVFFEAHPQPQGQ
ncbi:MAG: tetratricopeptide repeat protein, partial [Rhodospirillales bacterium]|nr:tetratricopeptide repeat protein [Rhodospirillales bacterium]